MELLAGEPEQNAEKLKAESQAAGKPNAQKEKSQAAEKLNAEKS